MGEMYERIAALCEQKGVRPGKMCADTGISRGNIGDLKMGRIKKLSAENLEKIAKYFGVTTDYLLGAETEKAPTQERERQPDINQAKIALFGGDGEVTDEMWEEAIFAAQLIKERHKRKKGN